MKRIRQNHYDKGSDQVVDEAYHIRGIVPPRCKLGHDQQALAQKQL